MRGSQIGCHFYFGRVAVLVAVGQKIILRMEERPGPATTGALRKQNILREAQRQSRPPGMHRRTGRFARIRLSRSLSATAGEAAGCRIQDHASALPSVRREWEDSGQFLYRGVHNSAVVDEWKSPTHSGRGGL